MKSIRKDLGKIEAFHSILEIRFLFGSKKERGPYPKKWKEGIVHGINRQCSFRKISHCY